MGDQTTGQSCDLCGSNRLTLHWNWNISLRTDMISTFLNGDHVSVSSIHTRCCIAVKPLTTWEKTGGTQRTTTLSALLQVKANHSSAILGAFQLPQGMIEGLRWEGQLLQMVPQTPTVQGNYSWIPASIYSTGMPKKASNQHLNQASLPWNVRKPRKHWTLCSATSLSPPVPLSGFWFSQVIFELHVCLQIYSKS